MARQYTLDEIGQIINTLAEKYKPGDTQFKQLLNSLIFSESSGDNLTVGDNGNSIGLLQANRKAGRGIGYSVAQLQDPTFNIELGLKEIIPAYDKGVKQGLSGGDLGAYVSKVAQRPSPGNEQNVKTNWGTVIGGGDNKIHLSKDGGKTNETKVLGTQIAKAEKQNEPVAYPTPKFTPFTTQEQVDQGKLDLRSRDRAISSNIQQSNMDIAKQIQSEYIKKTSSNNPVAQFFKKALTPKPVFSAENNNQSTSIQPMDMSFLDNVKKTQGYGEKTFAFYGKGGHEGNDFRAQIGTPVKGYAGWVVDFAGQGESYYGNKVVLRNPQTGEMVEYAHLNSIGVKKGQVLGNNQVIATTGNSGYRPDGQSQQAHLHVNYYSPDNKKGDFLKIAQKAGNDFPMVASVNSIIDKAKNIINPKQVSAAEPSATPVGTPKKDAPNYQLRPEQDPNQPGAYYGKSVGSYQIKPGDNLTNIARQFNTTVQDFQRQNPSITNPNFIRAGESLNVPSAVTDTSRKDGYTIRSGDTLTSIAKNLNTTVNDLVRKNGIQNPNLIRAGSKLKV